MPLVAWRTDLRINGEWPTLALQGMASVISTWQSAASAFNLWIGPYRTAIHCDVMPSPRGPGTDADRRLLYRQRLI
jgi:hypothetical protein